MERDNLGPRKFKKPVRDEEALFDENNAYGSEERWWWVFQNPFGVVIMAAIAILLIVGLWFIFHSSSSTADGIQKEIIVIKSDAVPYKEVPDASINHGVENQDKEVYKRLSQNQSDDQGTTETVISEEEKPLETHEFPAPDKEVEDKTTLDQPTSLRKVTENVGVKMPSPVANEQFIAEKKAAPDAEIIDEKLDEAKPAKAKSRDKIKLVKGLSAGTYTIRIASFRKQETADRELQRVFDTLGTALNDTGHLVKRIESESGIFYVVTVGAFPSLAKAKQISKLLKEKNFDAIIQKAGG